MKWMAAEDAASPSSFWCPGRAGSSCLHRPRRVLRSGAARRVRAGKFHPGPRGLYAHGLQVAWAFSRCQTAKGDQGPRGWRVCAWKTLPLAGPPLWAVRGSCPPAAAGEGPPLPSGPARRGGLAFHPPTHRGQGSSRRGHGDSTGITLRRKCGFLQEPRRFRKFHK